MSKRVDLGDKDEYKRITKDWEKSEYGKALHGVRKDEKNFGSQKAFGRLHQAGKARGISSEDFYDKYAEGRTGADFTRWSKSINTDEAFDLLDPGASRLAPETKFGSGFADAGAKKKSKQRRTLLTGNEGLATPAATFRKTLLGQ